MEAAYSNAEKLAAVVEYWATPRLKQLLPSCGALISGALRPVLMEWLQRVPDESVPAVAAEIIERAKAQGVVQIGRVQIDAEDLAELEGLLAANLPKVDPLRRGYVVKQPKSRAAEG